MLENSKELKNIIIEKEDDINFLVANMVPGPLLVLTWVMREGNGWSIIMVSIAAAFTVFFLRRRLRRYLQREVEEWYETFLVLQLSPGKIENKEDGK